MKRNLLELFVQRFGIYYTIKILISFVRKRKNGFKMIDSSNARFATMMAGFSLYPLLVQLLPNYSQKHFIAGCLSAIWLIVDKDQKRTATISQMIFIRTVYFVIRAWIYKGVKETGLKELPDSKAEGPHEESHQKELELRSSKSEIVNGFKKLVHLYGDHIIWASSAFHICFTAFNFSEYLSKSYFKSLVYITGSYERFGPDAANIIKGMSNIIKYGTRHPENLPDIPAGKTTLEFLNEFEKTLPSNEEGRSFLKSVDAIKGALPITVRHNKFICAMQHPETASCTIAALHTCRDVVRRLIKIYILLNLASLSVSFGTLAYNKYKRKTTKKTVSKIIKNAMINTIRSCLMVAGFVGGFSLSLCTLRKLFGREYLISWGIAGAMATPSILIDKPGRLLEMNTFSATKTFESLVLFLHHHNILSYNKLVEMTVMIPTVGTLTMIMDEYPYAMNGYMTGLFKWIFNIKSK
ncbi:hypothetical protein HDV06_005675 [Boothiomyces sp. JEL0866]|nr:hypothetical protein HDV06_005675 [Boothiomyces sp. JEL0866]